MKTVCFLLISFLIYSCASTQTHTPQPSTEEEWKVHVFDTGYESFLTTRAQPINMYTENTLHTKNTLLVPQWNARVNQPNFNQNIYQNIIEYSSKEKYGLEFEYQLYQAFVYVAWKYGEKFNGLASELNYPSY